jgi:diacylglycerol kinase family enzyme
LILFYTQGSQLSTAVYSSSVAYCNRIMPSTFNEHPVTFSFSSIEGLTVSSGHGDLPTTISPSSLVCVLPTQAPNIYTLVHQVSPTELIQTHIKDPPAALLDGFLLRTLPVHLDPKSAHTTIIVSSASGGGAAASFYENIVAPLCKALHLSPDVVRTTSPTSISETVAAVARGEAKQCTILLLTGDTGVYEAINAANGPLPLTLAIFPLGTGNALANSYHVVRELSPLHSLLFGSPKPLPTFTVAFSSGARWAKNGTDVESIRGAVVVSWGFHASLVADAETLRGDNVGTGRFQTAARENLKPPLHRYIGRISYLDCDGDWKSVGKDDHFYVLATLCSNLEEKFRISPSSKVGENVLHVVYFERPESGRDVMSIMQGAYEGGKHVENEAVRYQVAKGLKIEVAEEEEKWRRVCVDGGIVVLPEGGSVEVRMNEAEGVKLVWAY